MGIYGTATSGLTSFASLYGAGPAANPSPLVPLGTPLAAYTPPRWIYVQRRFDEFFENIGMLQTRIDDGNTKQTGVRACLNSAYWNIASETANSFVVGSWGKQTRVRPSGDIDLLFVLPDEVWRRFESRANNKQSQLLQEVRGVLDNRYHGTDIRGDGQVVVVPFNTIPVEVVPAFRCADGRFIICDTNDGGRYKYADPLAEITALNVADAAHNNNARGLTRAMKKWQQYCGVSIQAFQLENLVIEFLGQCWYSKGSRFWYDWMVRDFLAFLLGKANGHICMPGTNEWVALGDDWLPDARQAFAAAFLACIHEEANREAEAGKKWQELFGAAVPVKVQQ